MLWIVLFSRCSASDTYDARTQNSTASGATTPTAQNRTRYDRSASTPATQRLREILRVEDSADKVFEGQHEVAAVPTRGHVFARRVKVSRVGTGASLATLLVPQGKKGQVSPRGPSVGIGMLI